MTGPGREPVVRLRDVSCTTADGTVILDHVNLSVNRGECVLLCGPSGSGKSTITKCINGLIPVFESSIRRDGTVEVCGVDPATTELHELAHRVGSVFQNPKSQFFNLTSTDELSFGLEVSGEDPDTIDERVRTTVEVLRAEHLLGRSVTTMSGGEKQSLVFASIDVVSPELYLLDEPTANLDEQAVAVLREHIASILAAGKTVIVAEHRLAFISELIDRALYVVDGRIERELSARELRELTADERERLGLRATNDMPRASGGGGSASSAPRTSVPSSGTRGLELSRFVCLRRGRPVFQPLDLQVRPGEVFGLLGANGVGKTTLLRAVSGLERRTRGSVSLQGRVLRPRHLRRACSLVMQDVGHQLFSDSVESECALTGGAGQEQIAEILSTLGLDHLRMRHPLSLSGGEKQRLAVACALLDQRPVLLLDEPTSGLDHRRMHEVSRLVRSIAERGVCVLVATRDHEFLERCCDEAVGLEGH